MTKAEIIHEIERFGCGKMKKLPLEELTREQIIEHLEKCKCPKLEQLKSELRI